MINNKSTREECLEYLSNALYTFEDHVHNSSTIVIYEDNSVIIWSYKVWKCKWNSISFQFRKLDFNDVFSAVSWIWLEKTIYNDLSSMEFIYWIWLREWLKKWARWWYWSYSVTKLSWVYLLYDDWVVVYVWQSKNIFNRLSWHRDKKYDKVEFIPCDMKNLLSVERKYINMYNPIYNKYK